MRRLLIVGVAVVLSWAGGAGQVRAEPAGKAEGPKVDPIKLLAEQIVQGDAAAQEQAIAKIKSLFESDPRKAAQALRNSIIKALVEAKRFEVVVDLTQRAILIVPYDAHLLENFQADRVLALQALGRHQEALVAAKQWFNVATMKGTSEALLAVAQCLVAVHPEDPEILKRFQHEQMAGAQTPPATQPAQAGASMLASIPVDERPYQAAIAALTAEDYRTLVSRGNLLLLAGKVQEAREVFERAYMEAPNDDLAAATENLARCMKAEDGTIGRANAWIVALRPPAKK